MEAGLWAHGVGFAFFHSFSQVFAESEIVLTTHLSMSIVLNSQQRTLCPQNFAVSGMPAATHNNSFAVSEPGFDARNRLTTKTMSQVPPNVLTFRPSQSGVAPRPQRLIPSGGNLVESHRATKLVGINFQNPNINISPCIKLIQNSIKKSSEKTSKKRVHRKSSEKNIQEKSASGMVLCTFHD
jgi:hypothetical protein